MPGFYRKFIEAYTRAGLESALSTAEDVLAWAHESFWRSHLRTPLKVGMAVGVEEENGEPLMMGKLRASLHESS